MRIVFYCCLGIIFLCNPSFGQAQLDTFYVQSTFHTPTLGLQTTYKHFNLSFSGTAVHPMVLQNSNLSLGIRVKYKKIGFALALPVAAVNPSRFGRPKAFGLAVQLLPGRYFLQANFQYMKGFDDPSVLDTRSDGVYQPDSKMIYGEFIGNYIFNHQKFSLRSALKMINIQKRSAGSWLVSVPVNYQYFITDGLSLPTKDQPDYRFDIYRSFRIGVGGGYAYTKVMGAWSATVLMTGGMELRSLKFRSANSDQPKNEFLLSPGIRVVSSIVYNKPTYFVGLVGRYLPGLEVADGLNARVENLSIRLLVGRRFR